MILVYGRILLLKAFLKKIVPNVLISEYKKVLEPNRVLRDFFNDANQYKKAFNYNTIGTSEEGIKELLIFHSHSIEKGLSHPNFRDNFGKSALLGLKKNLNEFNNKEMSKDCFEYQNAISVLKAYKNKHISKHISTPFFDSLFDLKKIESGNDIAGTREHFNNSVNNMNFASFQEFRTTQREFSKNNVNINIFKDVVKLSLKTPSVCNRQPWKVYVTDDKNKIASLLRLQGGFKGYELPPTLSLITVNREAFIGSHERNEPYVDGGLFLMNYVFSLTYFGLSSCILNSMLSEPNKVKVKDILGISGSEVLIAFIAAGYPKDKVVVASSARKPVNDILKLR
jgi:hypothetical protein